jgi:hypothetical protein
MEIFYSEFHLNRSVNMENNWQKLTYLISEVYLEPNKFLRYILLMDNLSKYCLREFR